MVNQKIFYKRLFNDQNNGLLARGMTCKCGRLMKIGKFSHAAEMLRLEMQVEKQSKGSITWSWDICLVF